jgi:hypothetical protein
VGDLCAPLAAALCLAPLVSAPGAAARPTQRKPRPGTLDRSFAGLVAGSVMSRANPSRVEFAVARFLGG